MAKPVAFMLAELGVTKSHSRPHVSNDNPFSDAHFRTLKYRPEFPDRFGSFTHAAQHCETFFAWNNLEHRHSGIGLHTPFDVQHSRGETIRALLSEAATDPARGAVSNPPDGLGTLPTYDQHVTRGVKAKDKQRLDLNGVP